MRARGQTGFGSVDLGSGKLHCSRLRSLHLTAGGHPRLTGRGGSESPFLTVHSRSCNSTTPFLHAQVHVHWLPRGVNTQGRSWAPLKCSHICGSSLGKEVQTVWPGMQRTLLTGGADCRSSILCHYSTEFYVPLTRDTEFAVHLFPEKLRKGTLKCTNMIGHSGNFGFQFG